MDDFLAETQNYLEKRAEAELDLAQSATHPAAVKAHYMLAGYYLDRLYGPSDGEGTEVTPLADATAIIPDNDGPVSASAA